MVDRCRTAGQSWQPRALSGRVCLFLACLFLYHVSLQASAADNRSGLPPLGNTPAADQSMSIEISDQFVWREDGSLHSDAERRNLDVWQKIVTSQRMPLHINPIVEIYKQRLKSEKWSYEKILQRATPFIAHIVSRLEARGLPLDLALLPVIESGYQSHVKSENHAAGLWQFVPATAHEVGLKSTVWFDDRADTIKSTRAALDYLSFINAEFDGNWEHTLAAYNAGPGRVRSAIRKNREKGLPTDFWSLKLPRETSKYVPSFIALSELVRQTPASAFELPEVDASPYLRPVDTNTRISLDVAAQLSGISEKNLRKYNGGLLYGVTPPNGPHTLMLPSYRVKAFKKNLAEEILAGKPTYRLPTTHTVVAGETIGSIAIQYGLSQRQLRELNRLENDLIKTGQRLAVLNAKSDSSSSKAGSADTASTAYVIKPGDTLSEIAQKFRVDITQIRMENGQLPNAKRLQPGQKLKILQRKS